MKKILFFAWAFGLAVSSLNAQTVVSSPNGELKVEMNDKDGKATYRVLLGQDVVLEESPLGLVTSAANLSEGLKIGKVSDAKTVKESYELRNAKKQHISVEATEQTVNLTDKNGRDVLAVEWHVDNQNVAFRYIVKEHARRLSVLVTKEETGYRLPEGSTSFNCPQMGSQSGFARTAPSYESSYEWDAPLGKNGWGEGYVFPALFKVGTKAWVMLNETGLGANYCASHLQNAGGNLYQIAFPNPKEFGGVGTSEPGIALPAELPWRTITVGRTMKAMAETTIQWDVVKEQYPASQNYQYGRATWSWIIRMDASCNYDEQKEYIDFAARLGYEYVLIDALWDTNIGYEGIERLAQYARTKNVGLFLWYNSNGYWNDAPQGPKGKMHRLIDRQKEMAWLQKTGIKGMKIDFIGSDKQQTMQMYEDILYDANQYGLMVIFHGCTLPRGWERMYPNFVGAEAVRASENFSFGQDENDREAQSATIHPVLRNAVGNMDFGGSTLNKHYSKDNQRGRTRRTSDVFALATAVLFQTPVQNFALAPNNFEDAPAWAMDFMKSVPVTWEDVRYIDGYPGKYLVMARKSQAGKWYVAAINAQKEPLKLKLDLSFLGKDGMMQVYSDKVISTDDKGWNSFEGGVKETKVKKNLTVVVPKDGAAVIVK